MTNKVEICAICAWRETCQKKFSMSGRDMRCADFSEDLSLKKGKRANKDKEDTKEEN